MFDTTHHVGFFAFPEGDTEELAELSRKADEALDALADDSSVQASNLHRRALQVAVSHAVLGRTAYEAYTKVVGGIFQLIAWHDRDQSFFPPADCRVLAGKVAALDDRLGEEAVLAHIARRDPEMPAKSVRRAYAAFKEVLFEAARRQAGITWAVLTDGAEERLAREREEREKPPRRPRLWPRPSARQIDRNMRAYMDKMLARELDGEGPDSEDMGTVWIALLPAREVDEVRAELAAADARALRLLRRRFRTDRHKQQAHDLLTRAALKTLARASRMSTLRRAGEMTLMGLLHGHIGRMDPDAVEPSGVYSPAQARRLAEIFADWEEELDGREAVLRRLTSRKDEQHLAAPTYDALAGTAAAAAAAGHALLWLTDGDQRSTLLLRPPSFPHRKPARPGGK